MRLIVKITPRNKLILPISYQQILQGYIYRNLSDNQFAQFLHEKGYMSHGRVFKLFTFSRLQGKFTIDKPTKKIVFEDQVQWQISSVLPEFIREIGQSFLTSPDHQFHGQPVHIEEVIYSQPQLLKARCKVSMLSPITIHSTYKTKQGKKITHFFRPEDAVFSHLIEENIKKKYEAYYGEAADDLEFQIRPIRVSNRDKVVSKFKGFIIIAWNGQCEISGSPELIQFAYNVGIGARNSQGFGMAELIEK